MKATVEKTIVVHITLDQEEAHWLKGIVQNKLYENESDLDTEMRERVWNTLDDPEISGVPLKLKRR